MRPLLDQSHLDVAWHAGQYQALPPVYVQNSALEIAWTRVVEATGTREGRMLAPFLTGATRASTSTTRRTSRARGAARRVRPGDARGRRRASRILPRREAGDASRRCPATPAGARGSSSRRRRTTVLVGWSEVTDSHGSPHGPGGGRRGPRAARRRTRSPRRRGDPLGSLPARRARARARSCRRRSAGSRTRCSTSRARRSACSVAELFGGPTRETIPLYWSHCGTTRARAWEVTGTPKLDSYDAVAALGREVVERGYRAFKTNIVVPGDEPRVLMPGFGRDGASTGTRRRSCSTR